MKDRLSKHEIRKDVVQESVEAVTSTVGEVTNIIINAVRDVSTSIGGLATDAFAIRDGARRARAAELEHDEVDASPVQPEIEPDAHPDTEPDAHPE